MKAKKVTRYFADCGKGYWTKIGALHHETVCKCWKNPTFKTCLSCKHKNFVKDSDGTGREWTNNDCKNPLMDFDKHFTPVHPEADNINCNCPFWEIKNTKA